MLVSGFKHAPVTQLLVIWVVASSLVASVSDTKYYFHLQAVPHIWLWRQFWRIFTWQICYANSTEVLFAALTFYNLRVIERLWGSRKFASFLLVVLPFTLVLPPLVMLLILRPLSLGRINYIPAGPTPILFAILAQFHSSIPCTYRYRVGITEAPRQTPSAASHLDNALTSTFTLTSKSMSYFLPIQLSLSQFPSSILPAAVGWAIGYAYRREVLPGTSWRVPAWLVGQKSKGPTMETLRRRLGGEESEHASTTAAETAREDDGFQGIRGRFTRMFGEQFTGPDAR